VREYAQIWQAADKIVYSKTLPAAASARTRIEHEFNPAAVGWLKASAERDLSIGGAELAGQAADAGLVDEYQLLLVPVLVGVGERALRGVGARRELELLDGRRFSDGTVCLRYRPHLIFV
jgi:dihydrofolate reductase